MYSLLVAAAFLVGCQENSSDIPQTEQTKIDMSDFYLFTDDASETARQVQEGRQCHSMQVLNRQLEENPGLYKKMYDVEYASRKFITGKKGGNGNGNGNGGGGNGGGDGGGDPIDDGLGVINIPVYVHVLYNTSAQNISSAQINSQIAVLNKDFRKTNADASNVPSEFANLAADAEINFTLVAIDRKQSSVTDWGTNDAMKSSAQGGIDPITPDTHLNIWVVNRMTSSGRTILGYAQFPGGNSATDGVVVAYNYFGDTGAVSAPFNKGRTTTHEVGHYLNLRHIWGDGRCRQDDFVSDTPSSDGPNYGCPSYPTVNCRSNDMTMNYMDYTDDACMYMFSEGQKTRMRSIFAAGGARASLAGN